MAEPKPVEAARNRRLQRRFVLDGRLGPATLKFRYRSEHGASLEAGVRDISLSGLSMVLRDELPGLRVGDILPHLEASIAGETFFVDLLVMHLTPANEPGAACGGLIYPERDQDLLAIRRVIRSLGSAD